MSRVLVILVSVLGVTLGVQASHSDDCDPPSITLLLPKGGGVTTVVDLKKGADFSIGGTMFPKDRNVSMGVYNGDEKEVYSSMGQQCEYERCNGLWGYLVPYMPPGTYMVVAYLDDTGPPIPMDWGLLEIRDPINLKEDDDSIATFFRFRDNGRLKLRSRLRCG